jgi:hypothetical protein|tara:strand:+ start:13248 stop:14288 length:1041 start_codon:yes stop_codon:yes gene_type:complete
MRMLIPSSRLKWLPSDVRFAHEYCFFLHDEMVRILVEFEKAEAHKIKLLFADKRERRNFETLVKSSDAINALRSIGRHAEARRAVINTIMLAMVSDCGHHIYEGLRCFEKGKIVPGFNLFRKPLLDNLVYFTWMLADEDGFYAAFTSGDPNKITHKVIGNKRKELLKTAVELAGLSEALDAEDLHATLFEANSGGLYGLFQHAVHLVTAEKVELKTLPENFNFIFLGPADPDTYRTLYASLPPVLLYLTLVVMVLHERISPIQEGTKSALLFRAINGYRLLLGSPLSEVVVEVMKETLGPRVKCPACSAGLKVTPRNAAQLLLADSFHCNSCRRKQYFPFSWTFGK